MRPRRERDVQRAILDFLATAPGVVAWKAGSACYRATYKGRTRFIRIGKVGVADIIGYRQSPIYVRAGGAWKCGTTDGRLAKVAQFLAIEVKRRGETPTPEQAAFLEAVKAAGGIAVVAYCVQDVAEALGLSPAPRGEGAEARG